MGMAFPDRVRVVLADDNQEIISAVRSTLGERVHIIASSRRWKAGSIGGSGV
jgi:flagellar biosynthesis GTPase FlhF